jgi:hypothetical protein
MPLARCLPGKIANEGRVSFVRDIQDVLTRGIGGKISEIAIDSHPPS